MCGDCLKSSRPQKQKKTHPQKMGTVTEGYSTPTSGVIAPGPAVFLGPSCRVVECLVEKTTQEATSLTKVVSTPHRTGTHPEKTFTKQAMFWDSFHSGRCRGIASQELERCRKRLGSLASVRPAFMDEWALRDWLEGRGKKNIPKNGKALGLDLANLLVHCHTPKNPNNPFEICRFFFVFFLKTVTPV